MKDSVKNFTIDNIQKVSTKESDEFFYAKICALSTRPNSHKVLITKDILKRDGETIRGKWIVANPKNGEFMSHDEDEKIVGIIPMDANIEYIEDSEGYTSMYVDAVLSKLYGKEIYDMFQKENQRNVSVEMTTEDLDEDSFGNIPITGLRICGVTILGKFINGSCPNANMKIVQFSEDRAEEFYKSISNSKMQSFANERKKLFKKEENKEEKMAEKEKKVTAEEEKEMSKVEETENKEKEMAEQKEEKKEEPSNSEEDTKKKMSDDEDNDEEDEDIKEKEKKMSTDSNVDTMASLAFLENETEQYKEMINKMYSQDKEIIMQEYLKMAKERDELKTYQENRMKEDKEFAVNKIMADVKEDLDEKEFEDLKKEGMACKYEDVKGFENKVKAFAYEKSKTNPKKKESNDDIVKFEAKTVKEDRNTEETADDIYDKYL